MKKLFLFTVALLTCLMVGATTYTLEPGENKIENELSALADGDTLLLQTGTYTEWHSLTFNTKVTILAAEGAQPIVKINKWIIAAEFEANGIEFTNLGTDYMLRTSANLAATITLKNCYLHDSSSPFVYLSENNLDGLFIDGCIFANNTRNEYNVVCASGTITNFEMRNSTVYNIDGKYAVCVKGLTTAIVDHCTFYNCGKTPLAFGERGATSISVSNTVFSNPSMVEGDAMIFYNYGPVDNCVYYNTTGCANWMATQTNCVNTDPLFADPTNGDFNFSIFSPLCFAATDGTHIGDPRWTSVATESINLPATLSKENVGAVSADMTYHGESDEYFDFGPNDSANDTLRWAKWLVNVNKCAYAVSVELSSGNSYKLVFDVIDPSTGAVVLTSDTAKSTPSFKTIDFSGLEAGAYIIRLKNRQGWSKVKVKSLTFTYAGGAVVEIPTTLPVDDAILSSGASQVDGYIDFASESKDNARWNIHVPGAIGTNVTIDVKNASGHRYYVYVYDKDDQLVKMVRESAWNSNEGVQDLGSVAFPAEGDYSVIVADSSNGSEAVFKDLTFASAGGAVVDIPGTLPVADAILSSGAQVNEDGYIKYASATQDNARWNINATKAGAMSVSMDVAATNGHIYTVTLYSMEGDSITSVKEKAWTLASGTMDLDGTIDIPQAGNYYVIVKNTVSGSTATYKDVTFTYAGGGVVTIPGTLLPADATLSEKAFIDNDTIFFAPRGSEGYTPDGWAKWNVTLEEDMLCSFKANCFVYNDNGNNFQISIINADNDTVYQKSEKIRKMEDIDVEVELGDTLLQAGNYVVQMKNITSGSRGRLMSVVVEGAQVLVITDDSDIDFTEYAGQTLNVQLLNRTFKGGMYNPICLPFALSSSALQNILKSQKSYVLDAATLEGQKLYVELKEGSDIYQGTPNMIKPSEDVENPLFTNVEIKVANPDQTTKGVLRLQGSFAKISITNNDLLVGANNTLSYPSDEQPYVKSMRAYFILQGVSAAQMPKYACFKEPGNAPTWLPIVGLEDNTNNGKFIRNGQFVIVRDGRAYNILGVEE